jgi:hypothetical protein
MAFEKLASDKYANTPGSSSSGGSGVVSFGPRAVEMARSIADDFTEDPGALAQAVRDQLARDIADIEQASAALRRAEPGLESWNDAPRASLGQPRPLWLLIGLLWLSTALVTVGAVVAIATLAG